MGEQTPTDAPNYSRQTQPHNPSNIILWWTFIVFNRVFSFSLEEIILCLEWCTVEKKYIYILAKGVTDTHSFTFDYRFDFNIKTLKLNPDLFIS